MAASALTRGRREGYQHEALLYRGEAEFLTGVVPFVRDGVAAGEPVMVALPPPRLGLVQTALGEDAEKVTFVDMTELGANPGRLVPVWRRFVQDSCVGGQRMRGVGESLWAGRRTAEVAECQLHEGLLNLAVPADAPLWLRCPYNAANLDAAVITDAVTSHPRIVQNGAYRGRRTYGGPNAMEARFRQDLPPAPVPTVDLPFGPTGRSAAADMVLALARGAGVAEHRAEDLVLAVQEVTANSLRHGTGPRTLRVWLEPGDLVCEVRDGGCIADPMVGRRNPPGEQADGRGLWTVNQLCDLVQVRSGSAGTVVRIHTWLPPAGIASSDRTASRHPASNASTSEPLGPLRVLASDLDGTLATTGAVSGGVLNALDEARARGVLVILVTGRRLPDLDAHHPGLREHVDVAVLENGAVLAGPGGTHLLAPSVPSVLTDALARHGVPHRTGEAVVECDAQESRRVLDVLDETGLDYQMVRNRAALMLLPTGVTKGSGLLRALAGLGLGRHNTIGLGDADNDRGLFEACEVGVAVANATPGLLDHADVILPAGDGEGAVALLRGPLLRSGSTTSSRRWRITLGTGPEGAPVQVAASPSTILVTGDSGSGKSFLAGLVAEQLTDLEYSALVIDPEGDHALLSRLPGVVTLGRDGFLPPPGLLVDLLAQRPGTLVLDLSQQHLEHPGPLRADALAGRLATYFTDLARAVQQCRRRAGRPHWLIVDEAASLFAADGLLLPLAMPGWGLCLSTYRPDHIAPRIHTIPHAVIRMDAEVQGTAVLLPPDATGPAATFSVSARRSPHVRHHNKYAEGRVPSDRRFVFRDERGTHNAQARNVHEFVTVLRDASPQVIIHHLQGGDFSRWIQDVLGDADLADLVRAVERSVAAGADPHSGRRTVLALLERRYLQR